MKFQIFVYLNLLLISSFIGAFGHDVNVKNNSSFTVKGDVNRLGRSYSFELKPSESYSDNVGIWCITSLSADVYDRSGKKKLTSISLDVPVIDQCQSHNFYFNSSDILKVFKDKYEVDYSKKCGDQIILGKEGSNFSSVNFNQTC